MLVEVFNKAWFCQGLQTNFFSPFEEATVSAMEDTIANQRRAEQRDGIDFGQHDIQTLIVSDVEVSGDAGEIDLEQHQRRAYNRVGSEVQQRMLQFCASLTTGFEKQAALSLRGYIYQMMEEYLGVFEPGVPQIVLYHKNMHKFKSLFVNALEKYLERIHARQQAARSRSFKQYEWEVPVTREYNETTHQIQDAVEQHAMMPYIQQKRASNTEHTF